tara:strand:+ start:92 stop:259 length:168 start_codon:yes stop_codon:yes gene_type:complete
MKELVDNLRDGNSRLVKIEMKNGDVVVLDREIVKKSEKELLAINNIPSNASSDLQ